MPEQAKKKGAPIDWFALEPAIARSNAVGVARRAPHPNAALLFYDYLLAKRRSSPSSAWTTCPATRRSPSPLAGVKILQMDPVRVLDEVGQVDRTLRGDIRQANCDARRLEDHEDHEYVALTNSCPSYLRVFVRYFQARLSTVFS